MAVADAMAQVSVTVRMRGLKELDEALRKLPEDLAGPITEAALRAGGQVILDAARKNIHSRSGRTAADLRAEVRVDPGKAAGAAAIGGTRKGTTGRAHVLRWLEFGTKPHKIVAGKKGRRDAKRATRALAKIDPRAAAAFTRGLTSGRITIARALKLPGGIFRGAAAHPGTRNQSPLTRALAEHGSRALDAFVSTILRGLETAARRLYRRAA